MFNRRQERNRRFARLAAIGLGLALLKGRGRLRRYAMAQMLMGGFGRRGFGSGRFGGYAPWGSGDFSQMPIPPFIESRLKTWHDQAHGTVAPSTSQSTTVRQV